MFTEDLSAFLADFGATVTIAGQSVRAIFDQAYSLAGIGPIGMASTQPRLLCATDSLSADPVGDAVLVNGAAFVVAEHHPDGTGISVLMLEVAA